MRWNFLLALCLGFILSGCGEPQVSFHGQTMGTFYSIKLCPPPRLSKRKIEEIRLGIQSELERINQLMSVYLEDSELSRFNRHEGPEPFQLSEEVLHLFRLSQEISEKTDGAFDITVAPLVNAWGFGPEQERVEDLDDALVQQLLKRVGYHHLEFTEEGVRKMQPDVACDLGAIAQGYGVDAIAGLLEQFGIRNYLVEIGGEIRTLGVNARGQSWRIAIETPDPQSRDIHRILPLSGKAIATSGDYRNFIQKDGMRYSHLIDPRTGKPVQSDLASVSVIHDDGATADAYATALMVMGLEAGYELAEAEGLAVLFLSRDDESNLLEKTTSAFERYLKTVEQN